MAVKASATVTLTNVVDIDTYYRYYLLQSSTAAKPGVPSVHPPASPWTETEPGYTTGSTNSLYTVDCTVFSDGHFEYGPVQLSSSYEAAKQAYNEAKTASGNLDTFISTTYNSYVTNNDLELSSVKTKVESISVGGTNLLTGTAKIVAGNDVSRGNGTIIDGGPNGCQFVRTSAAWNGRHADVAAALARCGAKVGDKVTISCLVRIPQAPSVANSRIYLNRFDRDDGDLMAYFKDLPVGVWTRLSRTASVTEYMLGVSNTRFEPTTADVADFACWKLEMGTVATDWSPCPADVDYAMSKLVESAETLYYASGTNALPSKPTSQVTTTSNATVNGWTKTLPSYAADNNHTYLYTCQQMRLKDGSYSWTTPSITLYPGYVSSQFTQTSNAITARVTTTEMNTKLDGYYTKTQTDSQIEARAESISLTVAQREIDKVSVGGRNLAYAAAYANRNTNEERHYTRGGSLVCTNVIFEVPGLAPERTAQPGSAQPYTADAALGDDVTISFDAKLDDGGTSRKIHCYPYQNTGLSIEGDMYFTPTFEWQRFSFTTKVKRFTVGNGSTSHGSFYTPASASDTSERTNGNVWVYDHAGSNKFAIRNFKVERGTIATDWTPAPEDVDSSISSAKDAAISEAKSYTNAQLSLTSESITGTVASNYQSKADMSKYYTSAQTDSAITTKVDAISVGSGNLLRGSGDFGTLGVGCWTKNGGTTLEVAEKDGFQCMHAVGSVAQPTKSPYVLDWDSEYVYHALVKFANSGTLNTSNPLHYWFTRAATPTAIAAGTAGVTAISCSMEGVSGTTIPANQWVHIVTKFKTLSKTDAAPYLLMRPFLYGGPATGEYWVRWVKLEKGNKATDWTPCMSDSSSVTDTLFFAQTPTGSTPTRPTAEVTRSDSVYAAWTKARPTYSATYPFLYTCQQTKTGTGQLSWTEVVSGTYASYPKSISDTANNAQSTAEGAYNRASYHYGLCTTAKATAAKTVTISNFPTALWVGARISVAFQNGNSAGSITLAVNSLGAKPVAFHGTTTMEAKYVELDPYATVEFVWDGTNWRWANDFAYTNIVQTKDSITTTVAQQIKEVDVGGKNLVLLSGEEVENTAYNIKNYSLSEEINPGDVLSCTIWGTLAASKQFGVWLNGGSVVLCAPATMTTVAPGVYRWENVTVPSNASSYGAVNKKAINVYHYPSGTAGTGKITRIKVERGNKATGWSPAPEDMDGRVSGIESSLTERITAIETSSTQTAEGFEDRIKKTVERLDQTDKSLEGLASSVSEVTASFVKSTDSSGNALLTLKTTANAMEARLSNQKLEFVDQGTVVASAGGQAFEMPNAVVKSSLKIGKFAWVPVGDDGIALTFVG